MNVKYLRCRKLGPPNSVDTLASQAAHLTGASDMPCVRTGRGCLSHESDDVVAVLEVDLERQVLLAVVEVSA